MEIEKVGKLIFELRKEKGLTQAELGDKLGVSPKTISKWETGKGLPDISILTKISEILEISVEELLGGKINENRKKKSKLNILIIASSILVASIVFFMYFNNREDRNLKNESKNNCTVIRTYDIRNIGQSNDENYLYITISEYQTEGVYTIKIPRSFSDELQQGNSYVFTFKTSEDNVSVTPDILFANSEIINVRYTDKIGMARESKIYCDDKDYED